MALIKNYAIWNNKGGVGKSTVTYHLATRYAEQHPGEKVLVIDMCPQANVSMSLLGGGNGTNIVVNYSSQQPAKTIVGYMTNVIGNVAGQPLPNPTSFAVKVSVDNPNLPENLYLLCGDGNLEVIAPGLIEQSEMKQFGPTDPWVWIHSLIRNYINGFVEESQENVVVFIDTNPAFGIYTEIAMAAADALLCPVNADDSSRVAADAMMVLLHGSNPPHPIYSSWSFAHKAQTKGLHIPEVHLIIGNRMTQYAGAAQAYTAMAEATTHALFQTYQQFPHYFTAKSVAAANTEDFKQQYYVQLRDFNTSGVVTMHEGKLLSKMTSGQYSVHGRNVTIDQRRLNECLEAVDEVLNKI